MNLTWNINLLDAVILVGTVAFVIHDRMLQVSKHDKVIEELTRKLTDVSDALIALATEFHTYRDIVPQQHYGPHSLR